MSPLDLSVILKGLENKWVALSDNDKAPRVFAVGDTLREAKKKAESDGHSSDFYLLYVRPSNMFYTG